jgi:aldose 1-epimerase
MTMMRARTVAVVALVSSGLVAACGSETPSTAPVTQTQWARITEVPFGTADGQPVQKITLRTPPGPAAIEMEVINYGGIILSLKTVDRAGVRDDIVLGFDSLAEYLEPKKSPYFGCLIGRYCNRIAKGQFTLDGRTYTLAKNNGENSLHGGNKGWDKVVWKHDAFNDTRGAGVKLTYTSKDGEEGYPGTVQATVTYTLTDKGELVVDYHATTDKSTVINLTQHSYFNLAGTKANDILGHELTINADQYTPVDATLIPVGKHAPVEGTPFDFRKPMLIGARINAGDDQIKLGLGYDHNYVLNRTGEGLSLAARVAEPTTGRTMEITTTEPGIQFYSGNFLPKDDSLKGKGGRVYGYRSGFCLETQHYPDSPNQPSFPSTVLKPGQEYRSKTVFTFGTK